MAEQKYFDRLVTGDDAGEHGTHPEGFAERTDDLPVRTMQQRLPGGHDARGGTAQA